ncbi:MAG TPA: hypothetical protein VIJ40_03395 [Acidimicrobiales bacterium]
MTLMIVDRYLEQHEFTCHRCNYVWRETYEVREVEDAQGGAWHYFYLGGSPAASPMAMVVCPNCKQTSPTGQLVDRRRLFSADES